jgi:diguanylate cyclase (GGDEF)-like protein
MIEATLKEKQWILVKYAHALVRPLGAAGMLFGLTALAGYFGSIETLYRPFTNGPATNPLTAICIIFIGLGLQKSSIKKQDEWQQRIFAFLVIVITSARIIDVSINSNISSLITPFQDQVLLELQTGKSNSMGLNSAIMFLCVAISLTLYSFRWFASSQFVAFFTIAIPTISFTGYAYKLDNFYGQMSMLTATAGFALAIASLAMTAHIGGLKALLSPYIGGKIARLQTIAGYAFPTILGYLLIKTLSSSEGNLFGLFVVTICWFIILMVSISAIFQEKIDHERRKGERLLAKAALTDPLTGLSNRRRLLKFGQEEINRVLRNKKQFWLLFIDIDHFKKINDTAGHDLGDQVLIKFGKTLQDSVRAVDLVSRIGGEEFSIILLDTTKQGAERVAEGIRMNIEKTSFEGWTDTHGPVTASIGCATNDGHSTLEETIRFADEALYRAKENGRNQVIFADQIM